MGRGLQAGSTRTAGGQSQDRQSGRQADNIFSRSVTSFSDEMVRAASYIGLLRAAIGEGCVRVDRDHGDRIAYTI